MPGFLTDVVRPPGNPGMDANWKRRRSGRVPIGEGLVAGSRAAFSKIGDAVTVAVEAGRQLHTYSPRATLRLWRGCEVSTSALQGCGGLGVVLPRGAWCSKCGFGGGRLPSLPPLALDIRAWSLENAFCRIVQVKS